MSLVEELRSKKSRDNRELLDRAADRIEELERQCKQIFEGFTKHKVCTNEEDFKVLDELKEKYVGSEGAV